ncbi:hypothetical protein KEM56_001500 [Ascosphaera pollenicola]|nr:hypothetical protein KEM56_001500 [Ascosphaera pollenicola]
MHFATLAQTVLALSALANANPVGKRVFDYETDYVIHVDYVTKTVTPGQDAAQVPAPTLTVQHSSQQPSASPNVINHAVQPGVSETAWTSVWGEIPNAGGATATQTPVVKPQTPQPSPAPASASPSPSPSPSTAAQSTNSYQQMILDSHNLHRANHSAPALQWSSDLESSAKLLAETCVYGHNTHLGSGGYGQNIGYGVSAEHVDRMITNMMYNDEEGFFEPYYGQANPGGDFEKYGHFTQMVWKDTTHIGCVTYTCQSLQNSGSSQSLPYTVCNFLPAGNVGGEYDTNVLKPLGHAYSKAA